MTMDELVKLALDQGFDYAGPLDTSNLTSLQDMRESCIQNTCGRYGTNWGCPPAVGELSELQARMRSYKTAIIVQSVQQLEDSFDFEGIAELGQRHGKNFRELFEKLKAQYPGMLPLCNTGCSLCQKCTYPDEPCRFPDKQVYSMSAYGLFVSQVCKDNGMEYNHGKDTMTYSSCFLLE